MQDNLTVIVAAAAVVLVLTTLNPVYCKQTPKQDVINSDSVCSPCPDNSSFYHVIIHRENCNFSLSYMFVDLCSSNICCNVAAKTYVHPADIRGKKHTCACVCACR